MLAAVGASYEMVMVSVVFIIIRIPGRNESGSKINFHLLGFFIAHVLLMFLSISKKSDLFSNLFDFFRVVNFFEYGFNLLFMLLCSIAVGLLLRLLMKQLYKLIENSRIDSQLISLCKYLLFLCFLANTIEFLL